MTRRLVQYGLWLALAVVGMALALHVAYFARGSLELHSTEEQQAKMQLVTGVLAALLGAVALSL